MASKLLQLLARLDEVKEGTGGRYQANCPACGDKGRHLYIHQTEDKILINCFKGCKADEIMKTIGLPMTDLFNDKATDPPQAKQMGKQIGKIVWPIMDTADVLKAQHVRFDYEDGTKDYAWYKNGSRGLKGLKVSELPFYRINEAIYETGDIFVCEGESDTDALHQKGYRSIGTVTGAKSTPGIEAIKEVLALGDYDHIYLWPDNDDVGRDHMNRIAKIMMELKVTPYIIQWIEAGLHEGAANYAGTVSLLIESARLYQQSHDEPATLAADDRVYNFTDVGNSERFIDWCGGDVHYSYDLHRWLVWNKSIWAIDPGGRVTKKAIDMAKGMYAQASQTEGKEERKKLVTWALKCEGMSKIKPMLELARTLEGVPISLDKLDSHQMLLGCPQTTVDLSSGDKLQSKRENLITKTTTVDLCPTANCDMWQAFLIEIMDGNEYLIDFLQRAIGYSLTGDTSERCMFILWGSGANGKSTLLQVISQIMGDYAMQTPTETLMIRRQETIPNDIARLKGARFVMATESGVGQQLNESVIKQLTGGDMVSARFMHGEWFDFLPSHKLWLATNHKPTIKGTDKAIWDRIRLIPFTVSIPDDRQDKHLASRLMDEASGILAWAVQGCQAWQKRGLGMPREVIHATQAYRAEQDLLGDWLEQCCTLGPLQSVEGAALYKNFTEWALENGERPISNNQLGALLKERGFERYHTMHGKKWSGLSIKSLL
ncbi:MAG: phage/plasmid primase, P4 family [Chloroflexota bacterium]|nr:phage/plasmid primase, P4 family [Chloroflexota bacterium]